MAYIRIKKIQNQEYAYLVESITTEKGPRQKVKQYLGKVQRYVLPDEVEKNLRLDDKREFVISLVESQLKALGFTMQDKYYEQNGFVFSATDCSFRKKKTTKEIVLTFEQGYLCTFTIQRLLSFTKSKDFNQDAYALAKYFLEAGLQISEEEFVKFYSLL